MKKTIGSLNCFVLISLLLIELVVVCDGQGPPPPPPPAKDYFPALWKDFTSAEGAFKVRYPGDPKETSKSYDSGGNTLVLHSFSYGSERFIFYSVDYRDLPNAPASPAEVKRILTSVRENRLMGLEGKMKVLSENETTRDGHPALYLEMEYLQTKRLRELDVINGRRHYTILVITFSNHVAMESENAYGKIATSFLESFHIVEP
jgi:hypothetical protein